MIYEIQMQFIPGNDQIWVSRLNPEDPIYQYDNEAEAQAKAEELQAADETGRQYRVTGIAATEETPVEETPTEETPTEETPA